MKKIKEYLINLLIILSIFLLVLIINKISPFGNMVFAKSDAIVEFKPMLFNFITKLKNGTLLNYSFNNGLGNPFIFDFIYHLTSPLNLIAIFFKSPDSMYLAATLSKIILGTITMTYYVKSKTDNTLINMIATISYIFSSWFLTYYYYLPWLDVFALFPLFQKGLEDLLNKRKTNLYIISLVLITISNFYLAFTIYIYTIIYFIISECFYKKQNKKDKLDAFNRITLSTIISFFMMFVYFFILFEIYLKMSISFNEGNSSYTISILDFLKSFIYGNTILTTEMEGNTFPNIACNTFVLINTIYFFINKKIEKKDKKYALITILLFILIIFIKPLDYILNMFHEVRGLTYRYSYIMIFLNIKLLITNLNSLDKEDYKKMLITIPFILLLILITWKNTEKNIIIFSICSLLAYTITLLLYSNNKYHKLLLYIIIIIQSSYAAYINIPAFVEKEEMDYKNYTKENVKYRLNTSEGYKSEIFNNNLYHNSKVTHLLSAMTYNRSLTLASKIGCQTFSSSSMMCNNNNDITNMLFNVKNPYYLEKIFAVNKEVTEVDLGFATDIKTNTENIIEGMSGINDIYNKTILEATEDENKYHFHTDNNYYLIEANTEEGLTATIPQTYQDFTQEKEYGSNTATIYTIKKEKLTDIYTYLAANQIKYTYYNDNKIEGTIHVDNNQIIYTSIPYDISWEIKIDGQKIKQPLIILDAFIGIEVTPGDHTISMEYKNNNYIGPAIVSITSIVIFIIYNIKKKKA